MDTAALFENIRTLATKTMVAIQPFCLQEQDELLDMSAAAGDCHHLLALDIIIDKDLKPWLLDINQQPSLEITNANKQNNKSHLEFDHYICEVDKSIKTKVVGDAIKLVLDSRAEERHMRYKFRKAIKKHGCYQRLRTKQF